LEPNEEFAFPRQGPDDMLDRKLEIGMGISNGISRGLGCNFNIGARCCMRQMLVLMGIGLVLEWLGFGRGA
jgi:hypothetical protein